MLRRPSLPVVGVVGGVVVVAALAIGAMWLRHGGQQHQQQDASIVVHGKRVPYAGRVPWSDAILDPRNPHRVVVFADGVNMRGRPTCVLPIERGSVNTTSDKVAILIAGYADPVPPNTACAPVAPSPQRVVVTLPSPLGQRSLIDATTGLRHPVLNPATVPNVGIRVPTGYVAQPISWDDRTGIVTRDWISKACATQCLIQLRYAPPTSHAPFDQSAGLRVTGHALIHNSRATIYTDREQQGELRLTETALAWTRPDRSRVLISVGGVQGQQTGAQAIQLARSIR